MEVKTVIYMGPTFEEGQCFAVHDFRTLMQENDFESEEYKVESQSGDTESNR